MSPLRILITRTCNASSALVTHGILLLPYTATYFLHSREYTATDSHKTHSYTHGYLYIHLKCNILRSIFHLFSHNSQNKSPYSHWVRTGHPRHSHIPHSILIGRILMAIAVSVVRHRSVLWDTGQCCENMLRVPWVISAVMGNQLRNHSGIGKIPQVFCQSCFGCQVE